MQYIPEEIINEIQEQINIVDLVGKYVSLSKKGSNYLCSCPFHEDRNPSFSVSQSKQIYKCFSCGRGGNVFGFLQEIEGVSFPESVVLAADFINYQIPEQYQFQSSTTDNLTKRLYEIHRQVVQFYHYYLTETQNGQVAYDYIKQRNFPDKIIQEFQIGFAPENSSIIVQYLLNKGFTRQELLDSGIFFVNKRDELIDRFNQRLMIPLKNEKSEVIAFSGRLIQEHPNKSMAKYLNSPETAIFTKGNFLFNLDKARLTSRRKGYLLITEGYMDVMALVQAGFDNVVATMGTSLTSQHVKQIRKTSNKIYLVFDGDRAGQEATLKAFKSLNSINDVEVFALRLPEKLDPDDFIRTKGKDRFQNLINQSISYFEYSQELLETRFDLNNEYDKSKYIESIIELISDIQSPIEQALRIQELVNQFSLSEDLIKEQVYRLKTLQSKDSEQKVEHPIHDSTNSLIQTNTPTVQIESLKAFESEKLILFSLIYYQDAWIYIEKLPTSPVFYHDFATQAYHALDKYYYAGNQLPLTGIVDTISEIPIQEYLSNLMWETELFGYSEDAMKDCFRVIDIAFIQKEIDELRSKAKQYSKEQNYNELNKTMNMILKLTRQIKVV